MIEYRTGDMFESGADYLVCPVNCVGTMGKGLALEFKKRFPQLDGIYQLALRYDKLSTIRPYIVLPDVVGPCGIILFATKWHWREPSVLYWIQQSLKQMAEDFEFWQEGNPQMTVAVPKLGCGLGGLDWEDEVRPEFNKRLKYHETKFLVYE